MKQSTGMWRLVQYELRNAVGNYYSLIFGVIFPIFMMFVIVKGALSEVPAAYKSEAITQVFISMSVFVPLASIFLGHAANYSNELEKGIYLRMGLFGFSERKMLIAKLLAHGIFLTGSLLIYGASGFLGYDLLVPKASGLILLIVTLYLIAAMLFILAHAIALFFQRFGPAYAVTMLLYFSFMILGGSMGIPVERLPQVLRSVANLLPMSYLSTEFVKVWKGTDFEWASFVQAMLFFGVVSLLLLLGSLYYRRRRTVSIETAAKETVA